MKKLRQSTVERVFGNLTKFYGLRKIGVLGKAGAHKVMLMAAIAFNLKKTLRKGRKTLRSDFKDNHGGIPRLPDYFYPANPIKTGSNEGAVKTVCLSQYLIRRPLRQRPRPFYRTIANSKKNETAISGAINML